MLTRDELFHTYLPVPPPRLSRDGSVRYQRVHGVTQTWAVSRPVDTYHPDGAPLYIGGGERVNGLLMRGGVLALTPSKPNIEMDPSDPTTWQRPYRFD